MRRTCAGRDVGLAKDMIDKGLRVERRVSRGIVVTKDELNAAITEDQRGAQFSYLREVPVFLGKVAQQAESIGASICDREEDCKLVCSSTDLTNTLTPTTNVDGDLTARCSTPDCDNRGVTAAYTVMKSEMGLL